MTAAIAEPENVLTEQALTWPERARGLRIIDAITYQAACDELLAIKALRGQVEETFGPIVKKAFEAHREAVAQRRKVDDPLNAAEAILKGSITRWNQEQVRKQREEEGRLRKEAEDLALLDREIEIEQAEAEGATPAEVAAIAERPIVTAPVAQSLPVATPKVSGIAMRETWQAEVVDSWALIKYVAANPNYTHLLMPNMTAINQIVRALKSAARIPGVKVYSTSGVAARR